jgi:hypothetical protein
VKGQFIVDLTANAVVINLTRNNPIPFHDGMYFSTLMSETVSIYAIFKTGFYFVVKSLYKAQISLGCELLLK